MQRRTRHPALDHLDALVGEWETEATHPAIPNTVIHGRSTFEWLDGGLFLIWRMAHDHPDIPNSIAILGCDDAGDAGPSRDPSEGCSMHYFDERGVSRVYQFDAEKGVWRFWRDRPGFSQRCVYAISADGNTIAGGGELSRDGATWEQDLQMTFRRVK
jgi:hypothetical protein